MTTDYEKAVDSLWKDMREIRADMRAVLSAVRANACDRVAGAKENLSVAADQRIEQFRRTADRIRLGGRQAVEKAQQKVAERPFISLLAALGVGMLVGGLLRRSRR